jgi:hypothetical protein
MISYDICSLDFADCLCRHCHPDNGESPYGQSTTDKDNGMAVGVVIHPLHWHYHLFLLWAEHT